MHARRRDLKKPLHVRFRRSATVHEAVLMDVGQELALSFGACWFHKVSFLSTLTPFMAHASAYYEPDCFTLRRSSRTTRA